MSQLCPRTQHALLGHLTCGGTRKVGEHQFPHATLLSNHRRPHVSMQKRRLIPADWFQEHKHTASVSRKPSSSHNPDLGAPLNLGPLLLVRVQRQGHCREWVSLIRGAIGCPGVPSAGTHAECRLFGLLVTGWKVIPTALGRWAAYTRVAFSSISLAF